MKIIKLKLDDLIQPDKNVRIHTEKQIEEFVRSIKMFGQIRPVVVDENNTVLAGNGLVIALKKAGETEADVYKIIGLSENQKKKLMIADNKIFNLGIENLETLTDFLHELGTDLDIPGYDEDILQTMVAQAEDVTAKICEYGTLNSDEIEHIQNKNVTVDESSKEDEPLHNDASSLSPVTENEQEAEAEQHNDSNNYVICPKCGEKICL